MAVLRAVDPQPSEGVRLNLGSVAASLSVSFTDLAKACNLSRTAVFRVATENVWPKGYDASVIRGRAEALLLERGASSVQITTLWHAYRRRASASSLTDYYGRDPDPAKRTPAPRSKPKQTTPQQEEINVLLAKQTLSPEAKAAFELFINPFDGEVTDSKDMFVSGEIRFVREACWQAASAGRFVAVVGESGSGKTTLLADLKERILTDRKPTVVIEPSVLGMEGTDSRGKLLKAHDILTAIVLTLNPGATVSNTSEKRTRQAEQLLTGSCTAGHTHLLLIEEAHALPIATLKHLKRLHERMRLHGRKPMIGILLLGQPELLDTLSDKRHDVREVVQRVEIVQLQPLDHQLKAYLECRAKTVGRELKTIIEDEAIDALRARLTVLRSGVRNSAVSMVYPLAVNNLVTAALNEAATHGLKRLTREIVEAA